MILNNLCLLKLELRYTVNAISCCETEYRKLQCQDVTYAMQCQM
jgi:hypothetical protein